MPDATPLRSSSYSTEDSSAAPRSVPAKPPASGGLASRLWWAAAAAQQAEEDSSNLESLDEQDEEWVSEVFYMGRGGDVEAQAFVASLRAAGELAPEPEPEHGSNIKVKAWPRSAIKCDVPAETEYAVEVFVRAVCGDASNGSITKMHWSLLSSHYDAELEDLVEGAFDLSICPLEIPDWEDHTVQAAATSLHLAGTGEDWSPEDWAAAGMAGVPLAITPREGQPRPKVGVEGVAWRRLSRAEKAAARVLGWRQQADDGSWVEGAERTVPVVIDGSAVAGGGVTPLRTPVRSADDVGAGAGGAADAAGAVVSKLCFGKRRPMNSPDRADLLAAGAAGTSVRLRLDVSERGAHEPNWLLVQIDVGGGDSSSSQLASVESAEPSSPRAGGAGGADAPPPLTDLLAVIPAAAPTKLEAALRKHLVQGYRDLTAQGPAARQARWGAGRDADPNERQAAEAQQAADAAERAHVIELLDGDRAEELQGVKLSGLASAAATKLAEEEANAAADWAQRKIVEGLAGLYRSRMAEPVVVTVPNAEAAAAEAAEVHRVAELLNGSESGVSEEGAVDLLMQRELSSVASVALSDLLSKEVAPYVSAARRAAVAMGMMALFIPMML